MPVLKLRRKALALGVATTVALVLAEGAVRLHHVAVFGSARTRSRFSGPLVETHPTLGWWPLRAASVRHTTTEYDVTYDLDAAGVRVRSPADSGLSNARQVLVIGDSFTFGYGVMGSERFVDVLGRSLEGTRFDDLSAPGFATDQCVLALEEWAAGRFPSADAASPRADVVVLAYFLDHVVRNAASLYQGRAKPRFVLDPPDLRLTGVPVSDPHPAGGEDAKDRGSRGFLGAIKRQLARHSELYVLVRSRIGATATKPVDEDHDPYPEYGANADAWQVTRALLARAARDVDHVGANLVVVIIPEARHIRARADDVHQRTVAAACGDLGIDVLDLTPHLRDAADGEPYRLYHRLDGHWTAAGHAVAAEAIAEHLRGVFARAPAEQDR